MKILVRPELPTAALRSSQATHAAVDNSAPPAIRPESTYKSGKAVQTNGATSVCRKMGVSDATFYVWRRRYQNLGPSELQRLRQPEGVCLWTLPVYLC